MSLLLEPTPVQAPQTAPDDPRVGQLLSAATLDAIPADVVAALVGFPSDQGVRINGGRPGAAEAPDAIRHWLYRLTPDADDPQRHAALLSRCIDLGNVRCDPCLTENQQRLGQVICQLLQQSLVPILLGGGHETSYGHFLGYVAAGMDLSILNLDAHPDVRPLVHGQPHSGSPFRQALEHASGACRYYEALGLSRHATAASHVAYVRSRGGDVTYSDALTTARLEHTLHRAGSPLMVTMDIDAVDQEHAPGVSAPNPHGLPAGFWLDAAFRFGGATQVRSLDLVEVNPHYDVQHATARLAALTIWRFTQGLALRRPSGLLG